MMEVTARSVPSGWEPRGASRGSRQESTSLAGGKPGGEVARGSAEQPEARGAQERQARGQVLGRNPGSPSQMQDP